MNITATDFNTLTGPLLVSAYNLMVREAEASGLAGYRVVARFADRESAVRRCEALQSSLKARVSGEHYEDLREAGGLRSEPVPAATDLNETFGNGATAMRMQAEVESQIVKDTSPGRQRLLASGRAEELREQVLADQEKAAAAAQQPKEKKAVAKKVKENGKNGDGRHAFPEGAKITVLAAENPKREGTQPDTLWKLMRSGMLVEKFVEKAAAEGLGRPRVVNDLQYNIKRGFISVE